MTHQLRMSVVAHQRHSSLFVTYVLTVGIFITYLFIIYLFIIMCKSLCIQVIKSRFRQLVFAIAVQIKELERMRGNN